MRIKQTKTWSTYRRLLRRYRQAAESLQLAKAEQCFTISAQEEYKKALMELDSFVLSHIAIRAIARNLTIE